MDYASRGGLWCSVPMRLRTARDVVDATLEVSVVGSFSAIGPRVRRRIDQWGPATGDLTGQNYVVTGATSGIGHAAAQMLVDAGAQVIIVGRDATRTEHAAQTLSGAATRSDAPAVIPVVADMAELDQVREAVTAIGTHVDHLDGVLHNAGALSATRTTNSAGVETTVAAQVYGPFLMTHLLDDRVRAAPRPARVVTMSSGGMYAAALTVDGLQMPPERYRGADQYARAKRAQVTLNEMLAERVDPEGEAIRFHAVHPGWVDTPGVEASLPRFHRVLSPVLRSPADGADTAVWLLTDTSSATATTGRFWCDRRPRGIHRLPSTRRSDTAERRDRLWQLVADAVGVS